MNKLRIYFDALSDLEVATIIKELKDREETGILCSGALRDEAQKVQQEFSLSVSDAQKCLESYCLMRGALGWAINILPVVESKEIPNGCKITFQPQEWVNDYATNSGPAVEVDVTVKILNMTADEVHELGTDSWASDNLIDTDVLGHDGPFYVSCDFGIQEFFNVEDIEDITNEMILEKKNIFKDYL